MSEPVVRHEFIEYDKDKPFFIRRMFGDSEPGNRLLDHWHEDLEIAYCVEGEGLHYINGECIVAEPGRLIVTDSGNEFSNTLQADIPIFSTSYSIFLPGLKSHSLIDNRVFPFKLPGTWKYRKAHHYQRYSLLPVCL